MNAAKITLTATVVAAALGLALGLAAAPAQADCGEGTKHTGNHPHCTKGDTGGEPALLTLTGVMLTETPGGALEMTIKQNTAKRLQFGNSNLVEPGIELGFGAAIGEDCVVARPGDGSGPSIVKLLNELDTGIIDAGISIFRVDKKELTAMYSFEYWLLGGPLAGRVRVQTLCIGRCAIPAEVEEIALADDVFEFTIIGDMGIWWSDLSGLNEDIVVSCPAREVHVVLDSTP